MISQTQKYAPKHPQIQFEQWIEILKVHNIKAYILKPKDISINLKIDYDINIILSDRIANTFVLIIYKIQNRIYI